jgi:hypothetical protein
MPGSLAIWYWSLPRLELDCSATVELELSATILLELDSAIPLEFGVSELDEMAATSELDSGTGATPYRGSASSSEVQLTQKNAVNARTIFFQCL